MAIWCFSVLFAEFTAVKPNLFQHRERKIIASVLLHLQVTFIQSKRLQVQVYINPCWSSSREVFVRASFPTTWGFVGRSPLPWFPFFHRRVFNRGAAIGDELHYWKDWRCSQRDMVWGMWVADDSVRPKPIEWGETGRKLNGCFEQRFPTAPSSHSCHVGCVGNRGAGWEL